jgi:50S ribosomal subunit-associated GTPase HflX
MDLPEAAENLRALEQRFPHLEIVAISADRSDGIAELRTRLERWLSHTAEESPSEKVAQTAEVVAAE